MNRRTKNQRQISSSFTTPKRSMSGAKLQQAKKALEFCVENLSGEDRFEIVRFSTEAEPLFGKLVDADSDHRKRASNFIADLKPIGGTAIADALQSAHGKNRPAIRHYFSNGWIADCGNAEFGRDRG